MFVNFTAHPSEGWSAEQCAASAVYGKIVDLHFLEVDPYASSDEVLFCAEQYAEQIIAMKPAAVLVQGEMTLCFAVVRLLVSVGVTVLCACSERVCESVVAEDGTCTRRSVFKFVRFRPYI